jgi:hypothetical protein
MTIYELTGNEKTQEIKTLGHVEPFEFVKSIKKDLGHNVNIGDVKQVWECMRVIRGKTSFQRCHSSEYGAKPVTVVEID